MSAELRVLVLLPEMFKVMGTGFISPGAALGIAPGVMVSTQISEGAIVPQLMGLMGVPLGNAGEKVYVTCPYVR